MRKKEHDFNNWLSYDMYLDRLADALEAFAEEPTKEMDSYPCHLHLSTKEKCHRCSRAIEAWKALRDIE
jgi:hypothetical protein